MYSEDDEAVGGHPDEVEDQGVGEHGDVGRAREGIVGIRAAGVLK